MSRAALVVRRAIALAVVALWVAACSAPAMIMPRSMAAPAMPRVEPWPAPAPTVALLSSGMQVLLLRQRGLPLIHLTVVVKAGSALDGEREGLACATADMLLQGGAGVRGGWELAQAFEALGDELEITCEADGVTLHVATPATSLERALALLSDVLTRPLFEADEWRRERARRADELASERDDPEKVADRVIERAIFGAHPYGHAPLGTVASIARLEATDLAAFYATHYGPAGASLIVVGDLEGDLERLVGPAFGSWTSAAVASPALPVAPAPTPRIVLVDRPGAPQSEVRVGGLGVARAGADFAPAALLEMVLGGSFTSRLNLNLREQHGYTYFAAADFDAREAQGPLVIKTAVRTDATADAVSQIFAELRRAREPIPALELDKARALLGGAIVDGFSDGSGASHLLADVALHKVAAEAWSRLPAEVAALDPARLSRDAHRFLDGDHLVIVVVGDRAAVEPALRKLPGAPAIELRDVDGNVVSPGAHPVVKPAPPPGK